AASRSSADFRFCVEALGSALVQLSDPSVLLRMPSWMTLAEKANKTVTLRLKEILRLTGHDAVSPEGLAMKEAAIDLVRCLQLEAGYPDMIATAADRRLCEVLLFAAAEIGAALEPYLAKALTHDDGDVRKFACRALAAVSGEAGAKAVSSLL